VILISPEDQKGSLTIALVENVQRANLGPIELARAYRQLQEQFGVTQEQIASTVGKSRPHVANTLRLLELEEKVQEAIDENLITAGHARALLMTPLEIRGLLFQRMLKEGISVRQAEKAAKAASRKASGKAADNNDTADDPDSVHMLSEMARSIESSLGRKCIIQRGKKGSGRIQLEFYSDNDLRGLVEKLTRK
jgi:ParB family chromosome partitioning protein